MNRLFYGTVAWQQIAMAVAPTLAIAWLAARLAGRLATSALTGMLGDQLETKSPLVSGPLRLVRIAVFLLTVALLIFPAFEMAGLRPRTGVGLTSLLTWTFESGLRIALIVIFAALFPIINPPGTSLIFYSATRRASHEERAEVAKRIAIYSFLVITISFYIGAYVLQFFGISIPVLRVAGGLVVTMAAWKLLNAQTPEDQEDLKKPTKGTELIKRMFREQAQRIEDMMSVLSAREQEDATATLRKLGLSVAQSDATPALKESA